MVGYVQDRHAVAAQFFYEPEQLLDAARVQAYGRLVENEELRVPVDRLRDSYLLALRGAEA